MTNKMKTGRVILHVDMNSFYASVEMAHDPTLRGKPVAVAGNVEERKGIIITCSYEARAYGVKTTMPLWEAKKKCPQLVVLPPNFPRYRSSSMAMFDLLRSYTHLVEPVSIDEGYMDVTEHLHQRNVMELAKEIQERIKEELLLPCSIGIAPNKFLAKMASDMKKPMGITVLRKREIDKILWPLPVEEMHGVGKKTAEKLNTINIYSIKDLAKADEYQVKQLLGVNGERIVKRANGIDNRPVDPDAISDFKSIGNSTTLREDSDDERELYKVLEKLSQSVALRLSRKNMVSNNIQLMIRYNNRQTITRSRKLNNVISSEKEILAAAFQLFKKHWSGNPIRLLGVTAQDLVDKKESVKQLDLFSYEKDAKQEPLIKALDVLQSKYGESIIQKGIQNSSGKKKRETDINITTSFQKDFLS
ncbi:DNA polymerase IV [Sutcliffiella cohnii]|uniref:DNA polymerase IV n=2 Tax=Sutcliffiella TaxID=2837511 RepID=A0A223KSD0_9BACI|nr:DNA polymerase IV [Sutcliffiella cohnii]AST92412.1 DNA polymerase IV [Sutcliffiella cohnii]